MQGLGLLLAGFSPPSLLQAWALDEPCPVWGLGFRVEGLGSKVLSLGFRV